MSNLVRNLESCFLRFVAHLQYLQSCFNMKQNVGFHKAAYIVKSLLDSKTCVQL